jgi:hypothetical protein
MPNWFKKIDQGLQPEEYEDARSYFERKCWDCFYWESRRRRFPKSDDRSAFLKNAASFTCGLAITAFLTGDREEGYRRLGNYSFLSRLNGPRATKGNAAVLEQYRDVFNEKNDSLAAFACHCAATDTRRVLQFFESVGPSYGDSSSEQLFSKWRLQILENGSFLQQQSLFNGIESRWCDLWHNLSKEYYEGVEYAWDFRYNEFDQDPSFGELLENELFENGLFGNGLSGSVAFQPVVEESLRKGQDFIGLYYLGSLETSLLIGWQIFAGSSQVDLSDEFGWVNLGLAGLKLEPFCPLATRAKAREIEVSILNRVAHESTYKGLLNDAQDVGTLTRALEFLHHLPSYYEDPGFLIQLSEWLLESGVGFVGINSDYPDVAISLSFANGQEPFNHTQIPTSPNRHEFHGDFGALTNFYFDNVFPFEEEVLVALFGNGMVTFLFDSEDDWYQQALKSKFPSTLAEWPTCKWRGEFDWHFWSAQRVKAQNWLQHGSWLMTYKHAAIGSCSPNRTDRLSCVYFITRVMAAERIYTKAKQLLKLCLEEDASWEDVKNLNCLLETFESSEHLHKTISSKFYVFHSAVADGQFEMVEAMIANGADVNLEVLFEYGDKLMPLRPLHLAAIHGHDAILQLLLKHGADARAKTKRCHMSWTALHFAVAHGHSKVAKTLFNFAPPCYEPDAQGHTLHHLAKKNCDKETADMLYRWESCIEDEFAMFALE